MSITSDMSSALHGADTVMKIFKRGSKKLPSTDVIDLESLPPSLPHSSVSSTQVNIATDQDHSLPATPEVGNLSPKGQIVPRETDRVHEYVDKVIGS